MALVGACGEKKEQKFIHYLKEDIYKPLDGFNIGDDVKVVEMSEERLRNGIVTGNKVVKKRGESFTGKIVAMHPRFITLEIETEKYGSYLKCVNKVDILCKDVELRHVV